MHTNGKPKFLHLHHQNPWVDEIPAADAGISLVTLLLILLTAPSDTISDLRKCQIPRINCYEDTIKLLGDCLAEELFA